jgi:hypothetical protein
VDGISVQPDAASFRRCEWALREESTGDEWSADTAAGLHAALEPGVSAVQGAVMGMSSGGLQHAGEPLRATVAQAVESDTTKSGARIKVKKTYGLRGFINAPKRLNQRRGWKHEVYGSRTTVTQMGQPGWFDDTLGRLHPSLRAAAEKALERRARRISRKAP